MSLHAELSPDRAIDRAIALRDTGQGASAVSLLTATLTRFPHDSRLWQTLGTVHREQQNSDAAVAAFVQAARLSPGNLRALHGIAQSTLEGGGRSVEMFDRLHAMAPGDGSILLGQAAARLAVGEVDAAIDRLDAIVATNPLWHDGQSTLARLRWMRGDADGFVSGYRRALKMDARRPELWRGLIEALVTANRFDAAQMSIEDARSAIGDAADLTLYAAQVASERGDAAAADTAFEELAGRTDIAVVEQHVRHLLRRGQPEAAAARIGRLFEQPGGDRLWPYLSLSWRLSGDPRALWLEGDPELIGEYDLGLSPSELAALADRLRTLHGAMRDPLGQSVQGGTQTDGPLFAHAAPEIRRLRAAVVDVVDRHIVALGQADPMHPTRRHIGKRYRFAGSWSVRLTGSGHHSAHIHPQGWLSSACYIVVPTVDEMGAAPAGWLQLGEPPATLGVRLSPYRRIAPSPGKLVLFPSTMWHGTQPIMGGERLSIAFDVTAIG